MFIWKSLARKLYLPRMLKKWTSFDKMAHTCHVCALTLSFLSWILSFDIHFIHNIAFPYYNNNTTQASVHCVNLSIASLCMNKRDTQRLLTKHSSISALHEHIQCKSSAWANAIQRLLTKHYHAVKISRRSSWTHNTSSKTYFPLDRGIHTGGRKKTLNPKRVKTGWCLRVGFP